jgi:hypothetical protein
MNRKTISGKFWSLFSFVQAGIYLLWADRNEIHQILHKESQVRSFLKNALKNPEGYGIAAYQRVGIDHRVKRTPLVIHSYYVITKQDTKEYHTLSFNSTEISHHSEGAWALDTSNDRRSHRSFLEGNNIWDVKEIETANGIDTEKTIRNIIAKIDSDITYYYKNHLNNKPGVDNCNTALRETLAEADCPRPT